MSLCNEFIISQYTFVLEINSESTFLVTPENKAFVIGGDETDVRFECSVNRTTFDLVTNWAKENPGGQSTQVSSNENVVQTDKYEIEGEHNLLVKNVAIEDALFYYCENSLSGAGQIRAQAYLVVLGKLLYKSFSLKWNKV